MKAVLVQNDPPEQPGGSIFVAPVRSKLSETKVDGLVVYTDGSCKPTNPGFIGSGVHGYTYKTVASGEKPLVLDHYTTDQGYLKKTQMHFKFDGKPAGHVEVVNYFEMMQSSPEVGTNNIAEIKAVLKLLRYAKENDIRKIVVRADSQYTRQGLTQWCYGWVKNNWYTSTQEPVANQALWKEIFALYRSMLDAGFVISVHWVKAHDDNLGNVQADALAGISANYSVAGENCDRVAVYEPKDYWKPSIERHPMISHKRIYFNSQKSFNAPGCYFQADAGAADHLIGKRLPETGLSVVRLKEPQPLFEAIKEKQFAVSDGMNNIIMMKLDRVFDPNIYPYLKDHGVHALNRARNSLNMNWYDRKPVTVEVSGAGLSMRTIDYFNMLEERLDTFNRLKEMGFPSDLSLNPVNVHDMTDVFYEYTEVQAKNQLKLKCTLKPTFVVGFKDMKVAINEPVNGQTQTLTIPLILGADLLPRNNLKNIEAFNPKIYLITWREGEKSLRYATVISCDIGVGIWSNFFADRVFFN